MHLFENKVTINNHAIFFYFINFKNFKTLRTLLTLQLIHVFITDKKWNCR